MQLLTTLRYQPGLQMHVKWVSAGRSRRLEGTLVQDGAADGALRSGGGIRSPENLAAEVGPRQLVGIPFCQHVLDLGAILCGAQDARCGYGAQQQQQLQAAAGRAAGAGIRGQQKRQAAGARNRYLPDGCPNTNFEASVHRMGGEMSHL